LIRGINLFGEYEYGEVGRLLERIGKVLWKYKVVGQDWKESLRVQKDGFVQMEFLTKFWRKNGAIFYKI